VLPGTVQAYRDVASSLQYAICCTINTNLRQAIQEVKYVSHCIKSSGLVASLKSIHVGQRDVCKQVADKVVIVSVSAGSKFVRTAAAVALYSFSFNYLLEHKLTTAVLLSSATLLAYPRN
jgi:hypothetical protein